MGGQHEEREHKKYSPSQAPRFIACPGSVRAIERAPARVQSDYAIEGTKAHEILDAALSNGERRAVTAHREHSIYLADDFDDDFLYSIQAALNYIWGVLDEYPGSILYNECYVEPITPSAPGEGGGWCDVAIHVPDIRTLFVIDYKHGGGVAVEATSPQNKQYASGFLFGEQAKIDPALIDNVVCVIIQPRAWHLDGSTREKEYTPYEIYEYMDELDTAIQKCMDPAAPLVPEEKPNGHCTFCDAKTFCPAREARAFSNIATTFRTVGDINAPTIPDVRSMDIQRLSHIARWAPYLRRYLTDVDNHLRELMEQGYDVPDFKFVESEARRKWYGNEADLAFKLSSLANVDVTEVYRQKLISITDAEKLVVEAFKANVGRGKKRQAAEDARQAFALLTLKEPSSSLSVAPLDDPRPAINRSRVVAAFDGVGALITPPPVAKT